MDVFNLSIYILKFYIPALFSVLFRAYGLGYRSKKSLFLGLGVFTAYVAVVPSFLILTIGYGQFTHWSTVIMTIASMSVLIFTTDTPAKTVFLQLVQGGMTTTLSVVLNLVRTVFGLSYPLLVLMLAVASPLLYWFALRHWAKPLRFIADNLHGDLKTMIVLPIITMVVVYFVPIYPAQSFADHPVYCTLMMLGVELGFFLYIYTFYRSLLKISRLLKDEARAQLLQAEIVSYRQALDITRQARHDLRHHDALLLDFLENGDTPGAIAYLRTNEKALQAAGLPQLSINATANAALRIYSRQAEEKNIPLTVCADIPAELPLTAPELGALLANVLENAIEACARVQSADRHISFCAQTDEEKLKLEVCNSVAGTVSFENGMPVSNKPGGGTGTKSIARIVKEYGGMLRFRQTGGEFSTQIILPLR